MAGTDIETGGWTPHDTTGATGNVLHPLDPAGAASPGVQAPTPIASAPLPPTIDGLDTVAWYREQMAAPLAECTAAMGAGMSAENDRRDGYQREILPLGSSPYSMGPLPVVPEDATAPSNSFLYPEGGLQPTPEAAGFYPGYHGDEPQPG